MGHARESRAAAGAPTAAPPAHRTHSVSYANCPAGTPSRRETVTLRGCRAAAAANRCPLRHRNFRSNHMPCGSCRNRCPLLRRNFRSIHIRSTLRVCLLDLTGPCLMEPNRQGRGGGQTARRGPDPTPHEGPLASDNRGGQVTKQLLGGWMALEKPDWGGERCLTVA